MRQMTTKMPLNFFSVGHQLLGMELWFQFFMGFMFTFVCVSFNFSFYVVYFLFYYIFSKGKEKQKEGMQLEQWGGVSEMNWGREKHDPNTVQKYFQ